ncbi:MAG: LOG family protein [Saprospiraceae bacterium]|nr:LOG family protein [Saprospiraceae bacterium]
MIREIDSYKALEDLLDSDHKIWEKIAFQGLDLRAYENRLSDIRFKKCIFLGCDISQKLYKHIVCAGCDNALFPKLNVPYKIYLNKLYSREDLYNGFEYNQPETYQKTLDYQIYQHYLKTGKGEPQSIQETLARRLHDHAVTDALHDYMNAWGEAHKIVAIMGGHSLLRTDPHYRIVAYIAKKLSEEGYLMISGGGPGAMEATHLGTWLAGRDENDFQQALEMLAKAPSYKHKDWLATSFHVIEKFPQTKGYTSIGIPTWLYGHEPPSPFATHIAKYFANSVREEGLLAIAKGGIVFAPGSAGTIQEIFQDATQNHYKSYGLSSPMVFLGKDYWQKDRPIYPLLLNLLEQDKYQNLLLSIGDTVEEIVSNIKAFKPT